VRVGDLVKHKESDHIGLIIKLDACPPFPPSDDYRVGMVVDPDILYHIQWDDGYRGSCWENELEIVNEGR